MRDTVSTWPDFLIIERANEVDQFQSDGYGTSTILQDDCGKELESRYEPPVPEYDHNGNIITSEIIGYTEDGEGIWS